MRTDLILIDGLPGSGKSTLAADLAAHYGAEVLYETSPNHPLHPIPTDEIGAAWPKIHEQVSASEFAEQSLARWQSFLEGRNTASVVESFPFQSSIRVLFQIDASVGQIEEYWRRWQDLVLPAQPKIVFLRTEDPAGLMNRVAVLRGLEWRSYIGEAFAHMPFCLNRDLKGWAAVEASLEAYARQIESLIAISSIRIEVFEAEPANYEARKKRVLARIGR